MPTMQICPKLAATLPTIDYRKLKDFQGDLKFDLTPENFERLRTSLLGSDTVAAEGYCSPISVWIDADGVAWIIDGHQRVKLLRKIKAKPYDIPYVPISSEDAAQAKRKLLLHNSHYAEINPQGLIDFMGVDVDAEWLKAATSLEGYIMPSLDFADGSAAESKDYQHVEEDDFDLDETLEKGHNFGVEKGDVFAVGKHYLICGESLDPRIYALAVKLAGGLFHMMLTDPPYNVDYQGNTKEKLTIANDSMSPEEFYQFLLSFYSASVQAVRQGGAAYIWHSSLEVESFVGAFKKAGFLYKQQLIWVKNQLIMGRQDYQWQHEPCIYGWRAGAAHSWHSDRKQTTVLEFDKPKRNEEHPTMKPVPLFAYQIQNSSAEGEWVLDPFGGSGTTLIASEGCARRSLSVELMPKYCNVILNRAHKLGLKIDKLKNISQ